MAAVGRGPGEARAGLRRAGGPANEAEGLVPSGQRVDADRQSKVIAAVCHGLAALLAARREDGTWPFAGRRMTAFTDEEEVAFGTADNAPWLLAETLRKSGAAFEQGPNWGVFTVRDGNLVTGQNPASSAMLATTVIEALR